MEKKKTGYGLYCLDRQALCAMKLTGSVHKSAGCIRSYVKLATQAVEPVEGLTGSVHKSAGFSRALWVLLSEEGLLCSYLPLGYTQEALGLHVRLGLMLFFIQLSTGVSISSLTQQLWDNLFCWALVNNCWHAPVDVVNLVTVGKTRRETYKPHIPVNFKWTGK